MSRPRTRRPKIGDDEHRALKMLVDSADGCTVTAMLAHGFSSEMLSALARNRLATIQSGSTGTQEVWMMLTRQGRAVLAALLMEEDE